MIYPAPAGVEPNYYKCGECGGRFTMPVVSTEKDKDGYNVLIRGLKCVNNPDHETYVEKNNGRTKMLAGPNGQKIEVDVLTQKPTTELATYKNEAAALATVNQANAVGLFPQKATEEQVLVLAQVAMAYGLDPIMGELIPYQGRPYITIAGRRRLDAAAGHHVSVSYRPPSEEEERYLLKHGAIEEMDVIYYCILTDIDTGATVEGFGRVKAGEGGNNANLPQSQRKPEMAQKRAERRAREQMFGPAHKPPSIQDIEVLEEGDESNIVEGTGRIVPPANQPSQPQGNPEPDVCPVHQLVWVEAGKGGGRMPMHIVEGEEGPRGGRVWCKRPEVIADITNRFIAQAAKWDESLKQDWRDRWGSMSIAERYHALVVLEKEEADPVTGEIKPPENVGPDGPEPETPEEGQVSMPEEEEQEPAAATSDEPGF